MFRMLAYKVWAPTEVADSDSSLSRAYNAVTVRDSEKSERVRSGSHQVTLTVAAQPLNRQQAKSQGHGQADFTAHAVAWC